MHIRTSQTLLRFIQGVNKVYILSHLKLSDYFEPKYRNNTHNSLILITVALHSPVMCFSYQSHTASHKNKVCVGVFFFPITRWGTMWELSFGAWQSDETFSAAKRQEQNEDQYGFCHKANRFWHLAECHGVQLLKMALAHINIALQQPEYRQGVREHLNGMGLFVFEV